jgi:LysM domain
MRIIDSAFVFNRHNDRISKKVRNYMRANLASNSEASCDILEQVQPISAQRDLFTNFLQIAPPRERVHNGSEDSKSAWRQLAPFLLIIGVVMLLLLKYFSPFSYMAHPGPLQCGEGLVRYDAQTGDSCWSIADRHGWHLDNFDQANPRVNCDPLLPGTILCVPPLHDV